MIYDLVSVIIPTYNRCNIITDAIESVLRQTYNHFEIIVVDDGSTDGTKDAVSGYGSNVAYIFQKNAGPSAARNTGIKNARGELIAFLDSDDAWLPLKLEKQVKCFAERPGLGLIGTGYFYCDENMRTPIQHIKMQLARTEREEILVRNLWPTPTLLIRRSCFDVVGMFNEEMQFAEDWDMWLRIAQSFPIATIEEPLVFIRKHRQSLAGASGNNDYNYDLWKKFIHTNRERFPRMSLPTYRKAMSFYYFNLYFSCRSEGDTQGARRYLLRSLISWPFFFHQRPLVLLKRYLEKFIN